MLFVPLLLLYDCMYMNTSILGVKQDSILRGVAVGQRRPNEYNINSEKSEYDTGIFGDCHGPPLVCWYLRFINTNLLMVTLL